MAGKAFARETIALVLAAVMAVSLALTLIVGTAALIWNGQPSSDSLTSVASAFAWLFAGAFLISFAIAIFEERGRAKKHRAAAAAE